jgi:superfamily I DNA and/or RNA helicase
MNAWQWKIQQRVNETKLIEGDSMSKRKETKEEFAARVVEGVAKALRKRKDLVEAGRKEREEARKEARRLAREAEDFDNIEQIKAKIQELEAEQEENEYGSFAYDSVDAELQFLYGKLDKIKKQGRQHEYW